LNRRKLAFGFATCCVGCCGGSSESWGEKHARPGPTGERSEQSEPGLRDWHGCSGIEPSRDAAPALEPGRRLGGGDGVFGHDISRWETADGLEARGAQRGEPGVTWRVG
jgi:hypothetical protein